MIKIKKIIFLVLLSLICIEKGSTEINDSLFMTIGNKPITKSDFVNEIKSGSKEFDRLRQEGSEHLIEETGKKLRDMMSWMQDSKLVDEKIK